MNTLNLEYVESGRIHVICRVNQAEYAIRIPMAAPQEYVNNYSTRGIGKLEGHCKCLYYPEFKLNAIFVICAAINRKSHNLI